MQEQLKVIEEALLGKEFLHQEKPHLAKKNYACKSVVPVAGKFRIDTDSRTFILLPYEVGPFLESIEIVEKEKEGMLQTRLAIVYKEVIVAPEAFNSMSDGLMKMFNKISEGNATKAEIEMAKNASMLAGKIIDIEKVKLGYLALNKK